MRSRRLRSYTVTTWLACTTLLGLPACGRIGFDTLDGPGAPAGGGVGAVVVGSESDSDGDGGDTLDALATDRLASDGSVEASSGPPACPARTPFDYCSEIPALADPPVIDGYLDCGPALAPIVPINWSGAGVTADANMAVPEGTSASLAAAWRADGLYVFVDVSDPDLQPAEVGSPAFYGDAVEIYADSDGVFAAPPVYDDPGTSQIVVSAPSGPSTPSLRGEIYRNQVDEGASPGSRMGAFPTSAGYAIEAFIVAADLGLSSWHLAAGQTVGLDIAIDVSFPTASMTGAQGHRLGQYFLHIGPPPDLDPYQDVRSFCTPTLGPTQTP